MAIIPGQGSGAHDDGKRLIISAMAAALLPDVVPEVVRYAWAKQSDFVVTDEARLAVATAKAEKIYRHLVAVMRTVNLDPVHVPGLGIFRLREHPLSRQESKIAINSAHGPIDETMDFVLVDESVEDSAPGDFGFPWAIVLVQGEPMNTRLFMPTAELPDANGDPVEPVPMLPGDYEKYDWRRFAKNEIVKGFPRKRWFSSWTDARGRKYWDRCDWIPLSEFFARYARDEAAYRSAGVVWPDVPQAAYAVGNRVVCDFDVAFVEAVA